MSYFGEKGRAWGGPSPTHLEVYTKERVIIGLHKNIKGASSMDMYTRKFNREASEFNVQLVQGSSWWESRGHPSHHAPFRALHAASPSASSVKTPLDIPLASDVVLLVMVSSHRVSCAHVPSSIANSTRLQFYATHAILILSPSRPRVCAAVNQLFEDMSRVCGRRPPPRTPSTTNIPNLLTAS